MIDKAIERMRKISAMLRGEDASQPMMVQSTPIENNLCNFEHKNYIYARLYYQIIIRLHVRLYHQIIKFICM